MCGIIKKPKTVCAALVERSADVEGGALVERSADVAGDALVLSEKYSIQ